MSKVVIGALAALSFALAVIVIVLASLYGTDSNCDDNDDGTKATILKATTTTTTTKAAVPCKKPLPSMVHFPQIKNSKLVKLLNVNAFMKPIAYSLVAGKEMNGGIFKMNAGTKVAYTQWYEGLALVLSGSFTITDGTGKSVVLNPSDNVYIRRGTKVMFSVAATSMLYYVAQPPGPEICADIANATLSNPSITVKKDMNKIAKTLPYMANDYKSESYLDDQLVSKIKGKELAGGLYKLLKGNALNYTYEYEEFKYIMDGEFQLTDGTGKYVSAKGGDLMYFPKGTFVHFTAPKYALGYYVGQRLGGTA